MNPLVEDYLVFLEHERRLSPNTLNAVRRDLIQLGPQVFEHSAISLSALLMSRHAAGASPASLARLASSVRGFYRYLQEKSHIPVSPASDLKTPKLSKSLPKALKAEQVEGLIRGAEALAAFKWQRTLFLVELLYSTGLRIGEALSLHVADDGPLASDLSWISLERRVLQVKGKGGKVRQLPLVQGFCAYLLRYLQHRQAHLNSLKVARATSQLFVNGKGLPLHVRQAQLDMAEYARLKGLERHLHPHMLRHTFGSHVLQESQDLRAVQELLGHASVQSTQIYTSLDFNHLTKVYDQAFPRSKTKVNIKDVS